MLLDAALGTPDNLGHWEDQLLAYSAGTAPMPKSKRAKPSVAPSDLAGHANPMITLPTYAHLMPTDEEVARAVLDAALAPPADTTRTEQRTHTP